MLWRKRSHAVYVTATERAYVDMCHRGGSHMGYVPPWQKNFIRIYATVAEEPYMHLCHCGTRTAFCFMSRWHKRFKPLLCILACAPGVQKAVHDLFYLFFCIISRKVVPNPFCGNCNSYRFYITAQDFLDFFRG